MITEAQLAGIDISKDWLDVAFANTVWRIDNDAPAITSLADRLLGAGCSHVGIEPTGGYERQAVRLLRAAGLNVLQVDSWRCRQFAKASGCRAKTDALDAGTIRAFLLAHPARAFREPDRTQQEITAWSREIARIKADLLRLGGRKTKIEQDAILALLASEETLLRQNLAAAQARLDALIEGRQDLADKVRLLDSMPGIGSNTIRVLIAEMPELGTLQPGQAGALAGLAPYQKQSGKSRPRATIEAGRSTLRRTAFLAARAARLHNPWAKALYKKLRDAGKPDKPATIAIARRIIVILNAMLRDNKPWKNQAEITQP